MSPNPPDDLQRTLADLDARLGRIAAEVAETRAGLAELGRRQSQHGRVWRHEQQPQPPQPPQPQPAPVWRPDQPPSGRPDRPWQAPPRTPAQRPRRAPRITAATAIAAIGGAVMLAGVVFLLVAAIQAGLFPPLARVVAAAVLAAILVGLGLRLQARHEAGARAEPEPEARERAGAWSVNPGALALVGTGFAAAILDVIASTTLYQWVPVPAAYALVGGLALAGMILAQRWSSGLLACLIAAGTMLLSPLISTGVEWPVFLVIVAVATAVLAADLGHTVRVIWSVLPAPMLMGYLSQSDIRGRGEVIALVVAALAFAAAGTVIAWYDSTRREPAPAYAALVVVPTAFPLVTLPGLTLLEPGWPVALVLAAAYLVVSYLVGRRAAGDGPLLLTAVTGSVGSVLLLTAWAELGGPERTGLAVGLSAIAYLVAAGLWRRRWLDWVAGLGTVLAVVLYLGVNEPFVALSESDATRGLTATDVVASVVVTALAAVATWWASRRFPDGSARVVTAGAVVALLAGSVAVVALGVVIGEIVGRARDGFLVAHLVVTVLWICCAAWLVLTPRPRLARARRLGFLLGALALAKLLLLDLATLPGLFRVLSFIVVGAVMLAVAVRYRPGADPDHRDEAGPGHRDEAGPGYRSETEPSGSGSPT